MGLSGSKKILTER